MSIGPSGRVLLQHTAEDFPRSTLPLETHDEPGPVGPTRRALLFTPSTVLVPLVPLVGRVTPTRRATATRRSEESRPGVADSIFGSQCEIDKRKYIVPLCLGVRGPGIAEWCSVASRVAS